MNDIDIDSMDSSSAREYVLAFITTLKQTKKEKEIIRAELNLWEKRVKLAEEKGEFQLKKGAEEKVLELKAGITPLLEEEKELKRKVAILKEKLKMIQNRASMTVDAEALLAHLQMAAGEEDTLDKLLREEEASQALKELKKKMKDEDST